MKRFAKCLCAVVTVFLGFFCGNCLAAEGYELVPASIHDGGIQELVDDINRVSQKYNSPLRIWGMFKDGDAYFLHVNYEEDIGGRLNCDGMARIAPNGDIDGLTFHIDTTDKDSDVIKRQIKQLLWMVIASVIATGVEPNAAKLMVLEAYKCESTTSSEPNISRMLDSTGKYLVYVGWDKGFNAFKGLDTFKIEKYSLKKLR